MEVVGQMEGSSWPGQRLGGRTPSGTACRAGDPGRALCVAWSNRQQISLTVQEAISNQVSTLDLSFNNFS